MKETKAEIEIEASAETVWKILTDFTAYPHWNPFIRRITGELAPGARLDVVLQLPGRKAKEIRPKVTAIRPNEELRWRSRIPLPYLFVVEHVFTIEPLETNKVRFTQSEEAHGLAAPLLRRRSDIALLRGFLDMNYELKVRAEKDTLGE